MGTGVDTTRLASELRMVLGHLMRRLRAEHRFSLSQGAVLGRLDREGTKSIGDLALAERVRPQSMTQTISDLEADGLIARRADPADGRRILVELTDQGLQTLEAGPPPARGMAGARDRRGSLHGGAAGAERAIALLRRLAED